MEGRTSHPRLRFGIGLLVVSAFVGWMLIALPAQLTETMDGFMPIWSSSSPVGCFLLQGPSG